MQRYCNCVTFPFLLNKRGKLLMSVIFRRVCKTNVRWKSIKYYILLVCVCVCVCGCVCGCVCVRLCVCVCVRAFVPARAHVCRLRYPERKAQAPYSLSSGVFSTVGRKLLNVKCVLIFPTNLSSKFLILRRTEQDKIKYVYWSSR